ncbi:unnamed protein product [Mytilus coruscus]|uniref:Uncharacterized protein n=1 Tax=Mytilus coruscus TaxID=42192 RepID=A0A6J8B3P3_MYTCO|nr:unnamed protein product [Mytilus coruscus]
MASTNSFLGNIGSKISGIKQFLTPSYAGSRPVNINTSTSSSTEQEISNQTIGNMNYNKNIGKNLPSENNSSGYNSTNITNSCPEIRNEQIVHSTPRHVVDTLSNGELSPCSKTNHGNSDQFYGPQLHTPYKMASEIVHTEGNMTHIPMNVMIFLTSP